MMKRLLLPTALLAASLAAYGQSYHHVVEAEPLDRGVVAVMGADGVFVSWRSLAGDARSMAYDVYRDGVKLNAAPLTVTNYTDRAGTPGASYEVRCIVDGTVADRQAAAVWSDRYLRVHLDRPAGGTSPAGGADEMRDYTYTPDDVSVGDVDGDGQYELFVKWHPTNQADNSFRRYTGNTLIDCYRLDGTRLWRIDMGVNIRSGNHYTQFMVYDFDGDGRAEMICKTAPGTIDGQGKQVILPGDDPAADYRNSSGIILSGPEYLTVFDGLTGAEVNTINYNPPRDIHAMTKSEWGDTYGNRCERYLACVAYLDGVHPSAVFCRGYYTYSYLWAVDYDGTRLTQRWLHASDTKGKGAYGEGAHAITVGDVDADGCDEIVYGAACIDNDGSLLYRTGAGHGDALHLAAMLPDRKGLQVFMPHEEKGSAYLWDAELRDAATGEIIFGNPQTGEDNGRGIAANVSANWPGYEYWSSKHRNPQNHGEDCGSCSPSVNFRVYWDGDLLDELLDGTSISKPNAALTSVSSLFNMASYSNAASCNSTKKTPNLQADILGDWREEVILHDASTESDLLIFTTTIPTDYRVNCLMQDRQYRLAVAWQNCAYNQPPHLGYNLEEEFNTDGAFDVTSGTLNQVVNVGDAIEPVYFQVSRAYGINVVEAPDWLVVDFDAETLCGVISGRAAAEGEYAYTIRTVGAADGIEGTLQGKIVVRPASSLTLMASYALDKVDDGQTPNDVYGSAVVTKGDVTVVDGKVGSALRLDGSSYLVQEGYGALDFGDGDFTVSLWVRSSDEAAYILHKGSTSANASTGATGNWVGIELKNGLLKFAIDDDVTKSGIDVADGARWFDGQWHNIVLVRDALGGMLYAYVDGARVGEASDLTGAVRCADEALVIGNVNVSFNNTLEGDVDNLLIYRGAMSAGQVADAYAAVNNGLSIADMSTADVLYTAVDAFTGLIVAQGDDCGILDALTAGVYIVVRQQGPRFETFKYIRR